MSITVYTLEEAAKILGVNPRTLCNHIHNGSLVAVKVGRSWRISEDNLRNFVNGGDHNKQEEQEDKKE